MWKATQRATDIENSWEARGFRGLSAGVACVFWVNSRLKQH